MKYFLILNLKRVSMGPQTITDKGLAELERQPGFAGHYKLIGECDKNGNLLEGIANDNFMSKPKAVQKEPKPVEAKETVRPMTDIRPGDLKGLDGFTPEQMEKLKQIKNDTRQQYRSAADTEAQGPPAEGESRGSAGDTGTGSPKIGPGPATKRRGRPPGSKSSVKG